MKVLTWALKKRSRWANKDVYLIRWKGELKRIQDKSWRKERSRRDVDAIHPRHLRSLVFPIW